MERAPWRNEVPKAGPAKALQLATPETATLANGLTLILSQKRGVPIVGLEPSCLLTFRDEMSVLLPRAEVAPLAAACVLFEELLPRVSSIAIDGPIERLRSNFICGMKRLPVRFEWA